MSKVLRNKNGTFAGSVGSGSRISAAQRTALSAPSTPGSPVAGHPSQSATSPVDAAYAEFARRRGAARPPSASPTNTYPARLAAYIRAQAALAAAETQRDRDLDAAGGHAVAENQCAACSHPMHTSGCSAAIQTMSDVYETCPCGTGVPPTEQQIRAAASIRTAADAYRAAQEAKKATEELRPGDPAVVSRGRKVPRGTSGTVMRTHDGAYGLRVLLRPDGGEPVWVSAANLDRQHGDT